MDVQDAALRDILDQLAAMHGFSLIFGEEAPYRVTMRVRAVPWDQLFDLLVRLHDLAYRIEGCVIVVALPERIREVVARDP